MPQQRVDGISLEYEITGEGEPLVFVHGALADRHSWALCVPLLAPSFRVVSYTRRGHGEHDTERVGGTIDDDVTDLAALIEGLGLAPAHVVGLSSGAIISLKLASRHPDLLRSVAAHEPPSFPLLAADPETRRLAEEELGKLDAVRDHLVAGRDEEGLELFVDTVAFGPGAWAQLPAELRDTFIRNAQTFRGDIDDTRALFGLDLEALARFPRPLLLSEGGQTPPLFPPVIAILRRNLPNAQYHFFEDAGHVPPFTHPEQYAEALKAFIAAVPAS